MKTSNRLDAVEQEGTEHCLTLDNHDRRIGTVVEAYNKLSGLHDALNGFVRGGDLGPGLAGEVRELQSKVDLILEFLKVDYVPEHTVEAQVKPQ